MKGGIYEENVYEGNELWMEWATEGMGYEFHGNTLV
jgi:hypothetical protein